jgi:hypothetical protein
VPRKFWGDAGSERDSNVDLRFIKRGIWAAQWPTKRQVQEFNAAQTAEAVSLILKGEAVYRGLGDL